MYSQWEVTRSCYQQLMLLCNGDVDAKHELESHLSRYVVYSLPCQQPTMKCMLVQLATY